MNIERVLLTGVCLLYAARLAAVDAPCANTEICLEPKPETQLTSHEPISVGLTWDRDDVRFMDFKLSLRYRMFKDYIHEYSPFDKDKYGLFFAFSGRFGQYIDTRESSPVINKRFNPNFFVRHWTDKTNDAYVDFVFLGHESNGQSINSARAYDETKIQEEHKQKGRSEFAADQLSRGWDYIEVLRKDVFPSEDARSDLSTYLKFKYFFPRGLLQKAPEEYSAWENDPEGKARNRVNGLSAMLKYRSCEQWGKYFRWPKLVGSFETGYRDAMHYKTYRWEAGIRFIDLPITFWRQMGYGSDLAQYYKKVQSVGIEVEIGSF